MSNGHEHPLNLKYICFKETSMSYVTRFFGLSEPPPFSLQKTVQTPILLKRFVMNRWSPPPWAFRNLWTSPQRDRGKFGISIFFKFSNRESLHFNGGRLGLSFFGMPSFFVWKVPHFKKKFWLLRLRLKILEPPIDWIRPKRNNAEQNK